MLCLTRNAGETIVIGENIEVRILSVSGQRVRLGITAPADVSVWREEVLRRVRGDLDDHPSFMDEPLEVPGRQFARAR